ncbi:MAG: ABC transporter permease, partial [Chthoniobacterales bacterium]|nr:ABC transporter permease [Chthoniobacterales bacterium]
LGIGLNTSIFSVVNAVLLRPLPYPEGERITIVMQTSRSMPEISFSFPDYADMRRDNTVFEHFAVTRRESYNLSGLEGREPEQISGALVTANFFNVIGLQPQLGRTFTEDEDRPGGPALAVISDALWQRLFARDPKVLGRALTFGGQPYTVVGVMPPQMFSPRTVEVWFPLVRRSDNEQWQDRENHPGLTGWARLKRGVSLENAQAQLDTIAQRLAKEYPKSNAENGVKITQFLENQVGEYRTSLKLLLAAVIVVLLIACANLANLLAARGAARSREFAIRVAIGATRWQITRQLLIESLALAVIGGSLGLMLAAWGRDLLVALSPPGVRRFQEAQLDVWVLLFTGGVSIATSIVFGLWPAWQMSRTDAQSALGGGRGSSEAPAAKRSREILVIAEVALTLLLLSAAALVLKSFSKATSVHLGFEPRNLVSAQLFLPSPTYDDHEKLVYFSDALLHKVRAIPGVEKAAVAANPPFLTGWQSGFLAEGQQEPPPGQGPSAEISVVSPDYFATIGTPLLRGRTFLASDSKDAPPVIIIDQTIVDRWFPGEDPIGKRVRINNNIWRTVVGVAPRLKIYGFKDELPLPQVYLPITQQPQTGLVILVRSSLPVVTLEKPLRQIVASLDLAQPLFDIRTMQQRVEETWAAPRLMTFLLGAFAALALLLAVVGLYGVMAYNGVRRMREIGVRLALGARRRQIISMMLQQGMRLLLIGLVLGFGGALAASRVLRSLLFDVSANDPAIYCAVTLVLGAAAAFACWIPARR